MANEYLEGIKKQIEQGDLAGAEADLHRIALSKDFKRIWGNKDMPVIWGSISQIRLSGDVPTAAVDLRNGKVLINPQFIMDKISTLEDLLFIILHERDHRLLRRIYRVDWYRLRKILDFNDEWVSKIRNVLEDAWINASVRSKMGIDARLPEQFYCWTKEDSKDPESGFDPTQHKVGQPKGEETALLTCLSPFVNDDIQAGHEGLYVDADDLLRRHKIKHTGPITTERYNPRYYGGRSTSYYGSMLAFPEWYDVFCDWLEIHKDDLDSPSPDAEHDEGCPQHGNGGGGEGDQDQDGDQDGNGGSGDQGNDGDQPGDGNGGEGDQDGDGDGKPNQGKHGHGGKKPCTCKGGEGLLSKPMTLKERLARVKDIIDSIDEVEQNLDADPNEKDKNGQDQPGEVFRFDGYSQEASWGGSITGEEIVPQEIEELDDFDRGLLEMGGSVLTDSHKTETVQIKGAVKRYADELVQNIATMRVTEHKIMRPDFNMPVRPSRRDMMQLGAGHVPTMWDTPQYLEQNELVVYTDVSGSMNMWYSLALYLTKQLREFGCEAYQFSTVVCKPKAPEHDNMFWGTGGTDFDTVAEHIRRKGFKSVIIITDNCDSMQEEYKEFMRSLPELYLVFLQGGRRPASFDPLTFEWGGRANRGFNGCSENITGIFASDVGKG